MKTIESILAVTKILQPQLGINVAINGFQLLIQRKPNSFLNDYEFKATFTMECNEYHIQPLIDMGVQFLFSKKTKSRQANDNTLSIPVVVSIKLLEKLDEFARHNHLSQLSMHNKVQLKSVFPFSEKIKSPNEISEHQQKINAFRKKARSIKGKKNGNQIGYGFN